MSSGALDPAAAYLGASAVVLGLGGFFVGAEAYRRFGPRLGARGRRFQPGVLELYAAGLGAALVLAVAAGLAPLRPPRALPLAVGLLLGAGLGLFARRLDRQLNRWYVRRGMSAGPRRRARERSARPTPSRTPVVASGGALLLGGSDAPARQRPGTIRVEEDFATPTIVCVAAFEELFYRGVLLRACLDLGGWRSAVLVTVSVAAFVLTHIAFGWGQVLAKTPLGILTTFGALVTGTVVTPVVTHVLFNLSVQRDMLRDERGRPR